MNNPLISVITISYNAAETITPTLHSVANQTFHDFEHIIIDGLSKDDTIAIARREGIPGLRILSEKDNGIYDAMNKGLRIATGQYVIFLNSGDTFATDDTLAHYAEAIETDRPDIIYADTVIVAPDRHILRPRHLSVPATLTRESFSHGMLICHQAFMVRREIAPMYDTQYRFSADYDWCIRCIEATAPEKCRNLGNVEIHYLDEGATEQNKMTSLLERFDIMRHHYGLPTAVARHISFLPRAILRKLR
ncbi:MAG: glycosyltransferase [Muribaculaceae bacterium]|nr:glycosyltransferase [Muribaculaceae bacterium]